MAESNYIFNATQFNSELERLQLLERISDPGSQRRLLATGLTTGWQCLEVGAGAGSIVRWMSGKTGTSGKVVAVDLDTRFIEDISFANVEIIKGDINQVALAANSFDLIHVRNVLIHIVDYQATLSKILSLLKPKGWLLLEEPDFSAVRFISGTEAEHQSFNKVKQAILQMFSNQKKDYALGIKLPSLLQQMGLEGIQIENEVPISPGGSDIATMMKLSALQLKDQYIATKMVTSEDIQRYCQSAENSATWATYLAKVSLSAQQQAV